VSIGWLGEGRSESESESEGVEVEERKRSSRGRRKTKRGMRRREAIFVVCVFSVTCLRFSERIFLKFGRELG